MKTPAPARLVVLVSGYGSNLQAVLDACSDGRLNASVVAVISNKSEAYGLERARQASIPALVVPKPRELERCLYDQFLAAQVQAFQPDWIVLAGWMRILSASFLNCFPNRVINLHPALPGTFPGTDAIEHAYEAFRQGQVKHTGVMVHLVPDEGVDCGPILGQEIVQIFPEDKLEQLEARVHAAEHHLLVEVLQRISMAPTA